jgi:hypothetical protein
MINAQTSKEVLVAIGALLLLVILGLISRQGRWRWSDGRERRGGRFRSALWATRLFYEAIGFLPIEVFPYTLGSMESPLVDAEATPS